ncbi:MAG TPA: hypothetical protein VH325_16560 [Bryobacteraceae bacterium]|nr:hypothetical protein [Bryobacteraceae bacterium]
MIKGSVYREWTNWFERQLLTDDKKLKPRYPASDLLAARAEIPSAIGAYRLPTDSPDEAKLLYL